MTATLRQRLVDLVRDRDEIRREERGRPMRADDLGIRLDGKNPRTGSPVWTVEPSCRARTSASLTPDKAAGERTRMTLEPAPERPTLSRLIERSREVLAAMSPEEREAMWQAQRESWVRGEMAMDQDGEPGSTVRP